MKDKEVNRMTWVLCFYCLVAKWYLIVCNPRDCSPPGSSVHGISQARILEWVAISFFRGSSWPRDRTRVPWIGSRVLYRRATREALWTLWPCLIDHSVSRNEVDGQPTRILLSQCSEDILDLRSRNLITEHNRVFTSPSLSLLNYCHYIGPNPQHSGPYLLLQHPRWGRREFSNVESWWNDSSA